MDNIEKRPKRPRIGEPRNVISEEQDARYERVNYNQQSSDYNASSDNNSSDYNGERQYQPRSYNRQNGGYNRHNGYNRQGGYNNRGNYNRQGGYNRYNDNYQPRQHQEYGNVSGESIELEGNDNISQQNYQPRPYNRQGNGYNNRQGGYNSRQGNGYNRQGNGYNRQNNGYNNNRQGGYNQGGYNGPRNQQGRNNRRQQQNRNNDGLPMRGKSFVPRPKRIEYEMPIPDPNEQIRLNKFMANAGICSRREADDFIENGLVKVNGVVVTELGTKISHNDTVEYDEKIVTLESKCYILLNKPKDCVTTSEDPQGRTTVMDYVKGACSERIYPVGRLDRNTTGVLLLTNDGDLASKLTHPKYVKKKIYHVWCDRDISEDDMQRIADGIELEDGPIHADAISYATEKDRNQAGIEIHSGRNRIVRRIFESLGYHVVKLDRVYFAGLTKKNLPRGRWRYLTQEEVNFLKMGSFE